VHADARAHREEGQGVDYDRNRTSETLRARVDGGVHGRLEIKEIIHEFGRAGFTRVTRGQRVIGGEPPEENDNVNSPRS